MVAQNIEEKQGRMSKRIFGQCNTADFHYLEHLSDVIARGDEIDLTNLSKKQKMAVLVLHKFQEQNVPFKVLLKLKEVIIWDLDPGTVFEYRLLDPRDEDTRKVIKDMIAGRR